MPCFEIRIQKVKINAENAQLFHDAMKAIKELNVRVDNVAQKIYVTGKLNGVPVNGFFDMQTGEFNTQALGSLTRLVAEMNETYMKHCVEVAARRFGWLIEENQADESLLLRREN